jgi:hypothetical protein
MEITEERLKELIDEAVKSDNQEVIEDAVAAGVEKAMKALPAVSEDVKVEVELDEADQPFESDGHYFQAVKNAALFPAQQDVRLIPLSVKATAIGKGYRLERECSG